MKKSVFAGMLVVPALLFGSHALAQATDNTKSNQTDPSNRHATADQQKNNSADIDLAGRIRRSIMADDTLSTYGHNVKVVAMNGTVTLNGVVTTAEEKMNIGRKAAAIAGEGHVVDELKIATPK